MATSWRCWTSKYGEIDYTEDQHRTDSSTWYNTLTSSPSLPFGSRGMSSVPEDLYKGGNSGCYAYQVFGEMPGARYEYGHVQGTCNTISTTSHGSDNSCWSIRVTGQQPMVDQTSVGNHTHQVFDVIPSLHGRVLHVMMHQVKQSVTMDVLNQVFSSYGVVERIFHSSTQFGPKILIQYKHVSMADQALRGLHEWYLCKTHCQLDIRHAYPVELQTLYEYSCALISEDKNDAGNLRHEAAMPTVEVNSNLKSVTPQVKRPPFRTAGAQHYSSV